MSEPTPVLINPRAGNTNGRIKRYACVGAALLLALLVLPRVLGGGSSTPSVPMGTTATATGTASVATTVPAGQPARSISFNGKNPFEPVIVEAPPLVPASAATGVAVPVVDQPILLAPGALQGLAPGALQGLAPAPAPTATAPTTPLAPIAPAPAVAPDGTARFVLVDVLLEEGQLAVRVRIDSVSTGAKVGEDFAGRYRVVNADMATRCASFLFGDRPFSLCVGDETRT